MLISEKERSEFDAWTGDDIQHADAATLEKAHHYYKSEGFDATAAAVYARLKELGHTGGASAVLNPPSDAEAKSSIYDFQEEVKQRRRGNKIERLRVSEDLQAPVRLVRPGAALAVPDGRNNPLAKESNSVAAHHSQDLLHTSDQQLLNNTLILPASGTAPKPSASSTHPAGQPLVQPVNMRGSMRTQQLLEQNRKLPEADKHAVAEAARSKGNDYYKCGAYAEAVEEYTVAIGLHPERLALYTNRAAAYLKLKEWKYAAVDATSALDLGTAQGLGSDPLLIKARLRRAEAYMGLREYCDASRDYELVLALQPDNPTAKKGLDKARATLGTSMQQQQPGNEAQSGMRRMPVQECDGDVGNNEQQSIHHIGDEYPQGDSKYAAVSTEIGTESDIESEEEHELPSAETPLLLPSFYGQLEQLRLEGNAAFRADKFRAAIELYSSALVHAPDAVPVYINRAMTYLRLQQYKQAHEDATIALTLQPDSHKAYHKRQQAKQGLGDYQGAIIDMQQCIKLAPSVLRPALAEELRELQNLSASADAAAHEQAAAAQAAGFTDHGSVQIQEEVEDPEEIKQRRHDELVSAELLYARKAAKAQQRAAEQRDAWRQQQEQQAQQLAEAAAAKQQAREAARAARREARRLSSKQHKAIATAAAAAPPPPPPVSMSHEPQQAAAVLPDNGCKQHHEPTVAQQQAPALDLPSNDSYSIEAKVDALKDHGNQMLAADRYAEAEAAYVEALQLDGDNVEVLLNLALLRLRQEDGIGALRCCEEVLAQQHLGPDQVMKAQLRRALALDLLDDPAAALSELAVVWEQRQAAGLPSDPQLAADMNRVASKVKQQMQSEQSQQLEQSGPELDGTAEVYNQTGPGTCDDAVAAIGAAPDEQRIPMAGQVVSGADMFTGMRASIPVILETDSGTESDNERPGDEPVAGHTQQLQQLPGNNPAAEASTANASQQHSPAAHMPQMSASTVPDEAAHCTTASSAEVPSKCKILVVEESSEEDDSEAEGLGNDSTAAGESVSSKVPDKLEESKTEHGQSIKVEEVAEGHSSGCVNHSAAAESVDVAEQTAHEPKEQSGTEARHTRSRSSGDIQHSTAAVTAAETALDAVKVVLGKDGAGDMNLGVSGSSRNPGQQEQQVLPTVSGSSSSSLSPAISVEAADQQRQWEEERFAELNLRSIEVMKAALQTATGKDADGQAAALVQLQRTAEEQREKGNSAFSKGQLQQALKHYNAALSLSPKDERSYANRAQLYVKLKRWRQVEEDCNTALLLLRRAAGGLDFTAAVAPSTATVQLQQKCMYRRALAWKEMGKLREAIGEAKQLLKDNPNDSAVQRLMSDLKVAYSKHLHNMVAQRSQMAEQEQQQVQQHAGQQQKLAQSQPEVSASSSDAESVSQVQRHRIVIEETDDSGSEDEEQVNSQQAETAEAAKQQADAKQNSHGGGQSRQQQQQQAKPVASSTLSETTQHNVEDNGVHASATASLTKRAVQQVLQQKQFTAPRSAVEFTRVAKSLYSAGGSTTAPVAAYAAGAQQQQQQLGQYVKLIEPSRYTTVFKKDLSDAAVEFLLVGLQAVAGDDPSFVTEALQQLSKVERFGIVLPMASKKKGFNERLQHIMQQLDATGQPLEVLMMMYKLA